MWLNDQCVGTDWLPAYQMTSMWPLFCHQYKEKMFSQSMSSSFKSIIWMCSRCGSISIYITQLSWKVKPARQSPNKHCPLNICESNKTPTNPTVSPLQKPPGLLQRTIYMFSFPQVFLLLNKFFTFWPSVSIYKFFYEGEQGLGPNGPLSQQNSPSNINFFVMLK